MYMIIFVISVRLPRMLSTGTWNQISYILAYVIMQLYSQLHSEFWNSVSTS